jgi:male-specific lethal 3
MKSTTKSSKFNVAERVLCYEPDLTKARVVYDAKILKVEWPEGKKKHLTSKDAQYLVHFQGWSATWDRYVTDEFCLKTTAENKTLQKKLFAEAEEFA